MEEPEQVRRNLATKLTSFLSLLHQHHYRFHYFLDFSPHHRNNHHFKKNILSKIEALKRAYAEIILNTAKEAAARIMVCERRSLRSQQDLFQVKEEALNMMMRMKKMAESKIADLEATSLGQKSKIEELEKQLHEAEIMVTDLRAELKRTQDELEKLKKQKVRSPDEEIVNWSAAAHENASQVNKISTSGAILLPPLDPIERRIGNNCFSGSGNATTQAEPTCAIPRKNYVVNPEIPSILMRSKEPELYRNGSTQRIQAFERNLLEGKSHLPAQADIQLSNTRKELTVREDEVAKVNCTMASPMDSNIGMPEKKRTGLELLLRQDSGSDDGLPIASFHSSSRKRRSRRIPVVNPSTDQVMKASGTSTLAHCNTHPCPESSVIECGKNLSDTIKEDLQKNSNSNVAPLRSLDKGDVDLQSANDTRSYTVVSKEASVVKAADKVQLMRLDSKVADGNSGGPVHKVNLETFAVSVANSDSKEDKTEKTSNGPTQTGNDRFLKYTFRRKRKKEYMSCPDENAHPDNNAAEIKSGEKQVSSLDPQNSSPMESSRNGRRLAQVARQLISLSEKKWWL